MISPPVGGTRHDGFRTTQGTNTAIFLLGAVVGSAALGAVLGSLGKLLFTRLQILQDVALATGILFSSFYGVAEIGVFRLPIPTRKWQVPQGWQNLKPRHFAGVFGLVLGVGVFTVVPFMGFYILLLATTVLGSPLLGAAVMGVFGLMRGLPVVLAGADSGQSRTMILRAVVAKDRTELRFFRAASLLGLSVTMITMLR